MKTDRRDARTLAEACRLGAYRPAHRASEGQRHVRAELAVRDALIRTRTRFVNVVRALTRRDGLRLPSGEPAHMETKLAALPLPPALAAELAPLRALWEPVNTQIAAADARLAHVAAAAPVVVQLMTTPGVGPVTPGRGTCGATGTGTSRRLFRCTAGVRPWLEDASRTSLHDRSTA